MTKPQIQLFVAGASARGARAREILLDIKARHLAEEVEVMVIDIHAEPAKAFEHRVIATPMLLKNFGRPPHRICGDLSRYDAVLGWLDRESNGTAKDVS